MKFAKTLISAVLLLQVTVALADKQADPAEIALGERLFLESRFAQSFHANPGKPDPVMHDSVTMNSKLANPFRGQTMNCRSCHLVDEHLHSRQAGMRAYADFARRTPIPVRNDGSRLTTRNSQQLVKTALPRTGNVLLHFDGEFASTTDLVKATLTGRNYGWLASEYDTAIKHIANIVRDDDGKGELAKEFGGRYRDALSSKSKTGLPTGYRINVTTANDEEIVETVSTLIAAYVDDLAFSQDHMGRYNASPYDQFLIMNGLPRKPGAKETDAEYSTRLFKALVQLKQARFITAEDGQFSFHQQPFVFGKNELAGMKVFFSTQQGNCVACHNAPHFTDFSFHNTGVSQNEYDSWHGSGAFAGLDIPSLATRNKDYNTWLPATTKHPHATGRFRAIPTKQRPALADLGLWNVFANPDMPAPQEKIQVLLCNNRTDCNDDELLALSIASFKTPSLRDLGHSQPYLHNGSADNLQQVIEHYISSSARVRAGLLRNGDKELRTMNISGQQVDSVVAFLKALNEDYE